MLDSAPPIPDYRRHWTTKSRNPSANGHHRHAKGPQQGLAAQQIQTRRMERCLPHKPTGPFLKCDCAAPAIRGFLPRPSLDGGLPHSTRRAASAIGRNSIQHSVGVTKGGLSFLILHLPRMPGTRWHGSGFGSGGSAVACRMRT